MQTEILYRILFFIAGTLIPLVYGIYKESKQIVKIKKR